MKRLVTFILFIFSLQAMGFGGSAGVYDLSSEDRVLAAKIEHNQSDQFLDVQMVPSGSAVLTESGDLKNQGIQGILHAASGSMTRNDGVFKPSIEGITNSIKNSLILAREKGYSSVAIPFIGGGIFLGRLGITKEELAYHIAKASLHHSRNLKIVFVGYTEEDFSILEEARERALKEVSFKKKALDFILMSASAKKRSSVAHGSLVDYQVHNCELVINPANTEVAFGGGLSGVIARASGQSYQIDRDAQELIQEIANERSLSKKSVEKLKDLSL